MTRLGTSAPYWLDPKHKTVFPDVAEALVEPDGLLAIGGDLSLERLTTAYRKGIFPWYSDGQPILWWAPNPRTVLTPGQMKVSRSLRKTLRRMDYQIVFDENFERIIKECARPRKDDNGTWITDEMMHAYINLHNKGFAHCVEVWRSDNLIGGLYGVALGKVFFGESMFSRQTDASKIALFYLSEQLHNWGFGLIDCQVYSSHLGTLGARSISRMEFTSILDEFCDLPGKIGNWEFDLDIRRVLSDL